MCVLDCFGPQKHRYKVLNAKPAALIWIWPHHHLHPGNLSCVSVGRGWTQLSRITNRQTLHARQVAKDGSYSLPRKCMNMDESPLKLQRYCCKNIPARTAKVASDSPNSHDSAVRNSTKPPDHPNYTQNLGVNLYPTSKEFPQKVNIYGCSDVHYPEKSAFMLMSPPPLSL